MTRWRTPVLLALLVTLFLACFTWDYTERDRGYSREAQLNPWLAAGKLLEANRLRVRAAPQYARLPASARVLVLATPLQYLDFGEQTELMAWVRRGGHLVTTLQAQGARRDGGDLIARELGVRLRTHDFDSAALKTLLREPRLLPVQLDTEGVIQARFDHYQYLQAGPRAPRWTVRDKYGVHAMRFAQGAGQITMLSDADWLHNATLGEGDHAALLWRVVDARPGAEVWLVHGMERPSLFALIAETATPFLLALALCVLVWLWAVSRRFGPLQSVLPPARRRLAEHLEASGRYLLRHGGLAMLYDASRQRLLAQVQRRYPQWRRLPRAELATQLAARARFDSDSVLRVLAGDAPDHLPQFAADLRLLNRLRKAL